MTTGFQSPSSDGRYGADVSNENSPHNKQTYDIYIFHDVTHPCKRIL